MRIVCVTWKDAGGKSGWQDTAALPSWAEDEDHFTITTVGIVVAESEEILVLAPSLTVDGSSALDPIRIYQHAIVEIEDIGGK